MRRAIVTGTATVSGIVLLLGLKPHNTAVTATRSFSVQNNSPATTQSTTPSTPSTAPSTAPSNTSSTKQAATTRTISGDAVNTRYGPVQVQVTFSGKQITKINVLQYPTETGRDQEINTYAIPVLNQQAMAAQSANIDGVSGATYTTDGYQRSLQSAIDKASA